jgi:hypothetical protein
MKVWEVSVPVDLDTQRAWARGWQSAGRALESVRRAELRALTEERALKAMDQLLSLGARARLSAERRRTSGLVEQQRLFSLVRQ